MYATLKNQICRSLELRTVVTFIILMGYILSTEGVILSDHVQL